MGMDQRVTTQVTTQNFVSLRLSSPPIVQGVPAHPCLGARARPRSEKLLEKKSRHPCVAACPKLLPL
jgi:hypothetical protein